MAELEQKIADELMEAGVGVILHGPEEIARVAVQAIRQHVWTLWVDNTYEERQEMAGVFSKRGNLSPQVSRVLQHLDLLPQEQSE